MPGFALSFKEILQQLDCLIRTVFFYSRIVRNCTVTLPFQAIFNLPMKKLFLDDLPTVEMVYPADMVGDFAIVRSYSEFVDYIHTNGLPPFISFDNDLGLLPDGTLAPDGYAAAKWLVYESGLDLTQLRFKVHSANPVAAEQIRGLLNNYIRFINENQSAEN